MKKFRAESGVYNAMKISIIIPVYNNLALTKNCIASITGSSYHLKEMEVIIVDDNSEDGTASHFTQFEKEHDWLIYHRNDTNLKFSGSCNAGADLARGEYIIFLNNDTAVTKNWDKFLLDTLQQDENTWMAGAKLLYPDGTLQHAGVYLPELTGKSFGHVYNGFPRFFPPADLEKEVQCVTAACIIMRKADFHKLGGFDTSFLNGSEDIDLCLRIINRGKKIRYQPKCEVIHFESKSEGRYEHSKQNAELLFQRWKDRVKPDMFEMIEKDLKICVEAGLLTPAGHVSVESGLSEPLRVQIPENAIKSGHELLIGMVCDSAEKTGVTLSYQTRSGYRDDMILHSAQIVYPGKNLILFTLGADYFSGTPALKFEDSGPRAEITSFSFYTYSKNVAARKALISIIHREELNVGLMGELMNEFKNSGAAAAIESIPVKDFSSASLNIIIKNSDADYILILEDGMKADPGFLAHALNILELQPKIGFIYSDISAHEGDTVVVRKVDFNPLTLLSKEKTDMACIFRKRSWEVMGGFTESVRCFKNYDLALKIMASGNWTGYKFKTPAFSLSGQKTMSLFDYRSERERILADHVKYLLKESARLVAKERRNASKTETLPLPNSIPERKPVPGSFLNRINHFLISLVKKKK